jgi:hypothetical protein
MHGFGCVCVNMRVENESDVVHTHILQKFAQYLNVKCEANMDTQVQYRMNLMKQLDETFITQDGRK